MDRAVDADAVRQRESLDPRLDVGEHLRLHRALQREVADDEVGQADLKVLPRRQPSPEAADAALSFEHQGLETRAARVVQVDEPGEAAADDGQVERSLVAHGRSLS